MNKKTVPLKNKPKRQISAPKKASATASIKKTTTAAKKSVPSPSVISNAMRDSGRKTATVPFTLPDLLCVFGIIGGLFFLTAYGVIDVEHFLDLPGWNQSVKILLVFLLQQIIFLAPVLLLLSVRHGGNLRQGLGLQFVSVKKIIVSVVKWYGLYLLFSLILGIILEKTGWQIPGYGEGAPIVPLFGTDAYSWWIMGLVVIGIAPLAEEIFFRGFLFLTVLKKVNYLTATLITAVIFSAIHLDFGAFFPRLILGLILNQLVMENNRSIVPAWIFHMVNNTVALLILLNLPR